MAVSVRAACSMPRLHSLDFDLPPKNHFDVRARWGNSSPVLILSLLEIVEQDSIHVKEAAPRLQPGWVRNACAAFEKGVAFSDYESHQNVQNGINCQVNNVQHLSTKSPNQKSESTTRLPKAKSWESLDSCRKKSPKKAKVPLPTVRPKICVECKRSLAQLEDKFKTHKDCKTSFPTGLSDEVSLSEKNEVLPTDKLPKATTLEETSEIAETRPISDGDVDLNAQNNELSPSHKTSFNWHCSSEAIIVTKSELANEITPGISNPAECQDNNTHELPLERGLSIQPSVVTPQPVGGVHGLLVVQNVPGDQVSPVDVIAQLSQQQEQEQSNTARQNDSLSQGQTVAATSHDSLYQSQTDATRPNDSLYQSQMKVDLQEDVKSNSHWTANLHGANETQPSSLSDIPSVRPKLRVSSQSCVPSPKEGTDTDDGQDTTAKNCMVHHGYAKVAVSIKSFSVPVNGTSESGNADREKEYESSETQCAIGESATEIYLRGVSYQSHESDGCSSQEGHNLTVSHRNQGGAGHCETPNDSLKSSSESPGLTITLANMHHYPPDRLETFLLIKEAYKNNFPISWENFCIHFNSSRQVVIPRERFCAKFKVSFENEKDQSDNMKSFKKALAKKWSRSDDRLEERKQRLSGLKLGSLRFQLLCHPLVSYDISELEECESDSEEEILESVTPFSHVPTYVIAKIFRLLGTKELAALKCTCKDFHWLINQFDITGTDSQWMTGKEYRSDPCMYCGKIQDPRGDVSLCQRHPKAFYKYSVINRQYWTCCNAVKETTEGCQIGLHNNRWATSEFQPNFICKPWKSQSWYITANTERWCDKEHL